MNILMISSYLPYPLTSGGHIRLFNLIRELSQKHTITLICEKRNNQTETDIQEVKKFCKVVFTIERKPQWSLSNIFKVGFSLYPFLLVGHTSKEMKQHIIDELAVNKFDVIHVETFYVMQNLPQATVPVVLVEHNIEYMVYKRYMNTAPSFLKPLLAIDITKLKYWEAYYWKKSTRLIAVSEIEKKLMKKEKVFVVPNGVDLQKFKYSPKKTEAKKRILFLGDFKWIQNRDSLGWIIKDVWPILSQKKDIVLWIVGSNVPKEFKRMVSDTILIDENSSKSTEEILKKADIMISPIRVGGGTSYKIIESMAVGLPVITTPLGAEGFEAENFKEMIISRYDPAIFAQHVEELLQDEVLRNKIIKNARRLIEAKYDWKIIAKKLEEVYKSVVV